MRPPRRGCRRWSLLIVDLSIKVDREAGDHTVHVLVHEAAGGQVVGIGVPNRPRSHADSLTSHLAHNDIYEEFVAGEALALESALDVLGDLLHPGLEVLQLVPLPFELLFQHLVYYILGDLMSLILTEGRNFSLKPGRVA